MLAHTRRSKPTAKFCITNKPATSASYYSQGNHTGGGGMSESSNDTLLSLLYRSCDPALPSWACAGANVAGLCSTTLWFAVLAPQVYRCWRTKSVEGLSPAWAVMNFTAAMNNAFFVFKLGSLPYYSYVSASYMPVIEFILLLEFVLYTEHSSCKLITMLACALAWSVIVVCQVFFEIYNVMEAVSVTLWSIETFPQVFKNMRRQSTHGLSNAMIAITTVGKTTDFVNTYLLRMPLQYVFMAFYSSSTAIFQTTQALYYWGSLPPDEEPLGHEEKYHRKHRPGWRWLLVGVFVGELAVFVPSLVYRGGVQAPNWLWLSLLSPAVVYGCLVAYYGHCRRHRRNR